MRFPEKLLPAAVEIDSPKKYARIALRNSTGALRGRFRTGAGNGFGEMAERLTKLAEGRLEQRGEVPLARRVRDEVPNNALPCMARRAIGEGAGNGFGEMAERLKALPC